MVAVVHLVGEDLMGGEARRVELRQGAIVEVVEDVVEEDKMATLAGFPQRQCRAASWVE